MPDTPATTYGLIWDPAVASQPALAGMKDWDGWADVPTTTIPLSTPLYATEQYLSSAPIERVVGGEPFRTGYDPYVIVDAQGRYVVIDGHHRAAMHLALGLDDMVVHLLDITAKQSSKVAGYHGTWMEPYYIRFGLIPRNERSINHITMEREDGVSVYRMDTNGMPIDPDPLWFEDGHSGQDSFQMISDRILEVRRTDAPAFVVKGTERTAPGNDGEPLLRDIEVVGEWDPREPLAWRDTDWAAEWEEWGRPSTHFGRARKQAAYTDDYIARGLALLTPDDMTPEEAQRWLDGDVTVRDVLGLVKDPAGIWWGLLDRHWGIGDIEDYAAPYGLEESLAKGLEEFGEEKVTLEGNDRYEPRFYGGEIGVVLVSKRPEGWDPDTNEANLQYARNNPLMGNSFIPAGTQIELTEVRYNVGTGWRSLPAKGITVTAQVQRAAQVQPDLEVQRTPSQGGTRHRGRWSTVPSNPQIAQTPSVRAISGVIGWPEAPSGVRRHLDPLGFPSVAEKWPTSEGQQL